MRFAIISDIHYGEGENYGKINPETGLNTRLEDIDQTFNAFIDYILNPENKISVAVVGGDIFKSRKPTPTQQLLFTKALIRICEHNKQNKNQVQVVIFTGNHDVQRSELAHSISTVAALTSVYEKTMWIDDQPRNYVFTVEGEKVLLCAIPYLYRQKLGMASNEQVVEFYQTLAREALRQHPDVTCKILCGHQTVEGCSIAEYEDINSFNEIIVPQSVFAGYDFVSQGHIHKYQVLSREPLLVYQGNPIQLDFAHSEEKGFIVYDTLLRKHKRVKISNTKFVRLDLDTSTSEEDGTTVLIRKLEEMQEAIRGTIFKIRLTLKEKDLPLRLQEIKPLIQEVKFFAQIEKTIVRPNRARNKDMTRGKTLESLLRSIALSREYTEEQTNKYVAAGLSLQASKREEEEST